MYWQSCRDLQGKSYRDEAVHFSRADAPPWKRNRHRLCSELAQSGVIREVVVDGCAHRLFASEIVEQTVLERLRQDPWCMADPL